MPDTPEAAALIAAEISRIISSGNSSLTQDMRFDETVNDIMARDKAFQEKGGIFFHIDSTALETAEKFTQIHVEQYRETGRPSLPALAVHHAELIGLDKDSPEYKAMIMVAVRAEMKIAAQPDYHSKFHYTDVAAMTANLLEKNAEMVAAGIPDVIPLTKQQMAITFIAAIGHDLDHDGKGNPKDNPTYNEQKSFELMLPLLEEAGLSGADINKIHTILMTTSPNGPHALLKEAAKAHREKTVPNFDTVDKDKQFTDLQEILAKDKTLTQMAAIVSDSDLYASAGAGIKASRVMSRLLSKETGMDLTTDGARKFFLDNIVGKEGFASDAGRAVGNAAFTDLRQETEQRLAAAKPKTAAAAP